MPLDRDLLVEFLGLQKQLTASFTSLYPSALSDFMLGVPRSGEFRLEKETWRFQRHGQGVRFLHPSSGRIVDAHLLYVDSLDLIDAWRILRFVESVDSVTLTE